ncbi:protein hunchback-like [Schistocerca piceifrons]|uniref:protein hunchback-like n=1 Tax=Schistocerca piceifrons TaxID=274613 RepID=UPI001F5FDF52|nr:protein hunchback-like [Schistocerca piceifrons]
MKHGIPLNKKGKKFSSGKISEMLEGLNKHHDSISLPSASTAHSYKHKRSSNTPSIKDTKEAVPETLCEEGQTVMSTIPPLVLKQALAELFPPKILNPSETITAASTTTTTKAAASSSTAEPPLIPAAASMVAGQTPAAVSPPKATVNAEQLQQLQS